MGLLTYVAMLLLNAMALVAVPQPDASGVMKVYSQQQRVNTASVLRIILRTEVGRVNSVRCIKHGKPDVFVCGLRVHIRGMCRCWNGIGARINTLPYRQDFVN